MAARIRHSLRKGATVNSFKVESVVSRSHSGITYRATHTRDGLPRLLREYFPTDLVVRLKDGITVEPRENDEAQYETGLTEFLRQTQALAQIHDPHIERIEDTIHAHNTAYQVIEFDEGQPLDVRIRSATLPLQAAETEKLFRELLRGLATLHDAGICHLDLTAKNVYLREGGPCMLTGFGNPAADSGFPSAETAQGDLASLAVLIYKCATGSRRRPSLKNVAIRLEGADLSPPIKDILLELLDPGKCKQYGNAAEVLRKIPGESPTGRVSRSEIERSVRNIHAISPPGAHHRGPGQGEAIPAGAGAGGISTGTHRQTKIIGGRISAVSRKPRAGGKAGWWILGTVIVLVGLAFLFPTPRTNETGPELADGTTPPTPERADIYAESRVDDEMADPTMPSTDTTFIRENDEDRANNYRMAELEEMKIQELLSSAAVHIEKLEYTEPPEGNALDDYRAALALNPSNAKANEGIVFIMDKLVESGLGMLDRDEVTRAGGIVDKIRQIESDSPQVSQLEQAVAAWRAEQETRRETERNEAIISMLKSAEDAMDQGKILSPTRDNALHYYRELLLFDPGNDEAEQGISIISQRYLGLANESILANDLGAAEGFLTTVEVIQSDNPAIALLREQIDVKKRQEAIGLVQPPVDTPVVVESSTTPATAPGREPPLLPRPDIPADNLPSGGRPVPEVVDLSIAETAPGNPVLNNNERQLLAGLEAYYEGRYEEAYEYLTPLSYRGIARAQFRIGIMYQMGRGVTRDTDRAEELITRALPAIRNFAEGGRAWAQADLGSLYEDGVVVTRDYEQAVHWYREGARQGYAGAQTNLGVMYALGRGVERNQDEAIRWLKLAADQGDLIASENLRTLGVRQE